MCDIMGVILLRQLTLYLSSHEIFHAQNWQLPIINDSEQGVYSLFWATSFEIQIAPDFHPLTNAFICLCDAMSMMSVVGAVYKQQVCRSFELL